MYTLTIAGLTDFEADHIGQVLNDYRCKMLTKKMEAMVEDYKTGGSERAEWFDKHLAWHDSIMEKANWAKD